MAEFWGISLSWIGFVVDGDRAVKNTSHLFCFKLKAGLVFGVSDGLKIEKGVLVRVFFCEL